MRNIIKKNRLKTGLGTVSKNNPVENQLS